MVSWMSSNANLIATDGMVTRPHFTNGDQRVVLTATLSKGMVTRAKPFTLTVLALPDENITAVSNARDALQIDLRTQNANAVTNDIGLTNLGTGGVMVSWASSDASSIATDGRVTRPVFGQSDQMITLTAILSKGAVTKTKIFSLTVLAEPPTDEQAVEIASNDLQIDLRGQATNAVISDIGLTHLGAHGVGISWSSSNADFIATNGMVTRPFNQSNAQVILTATLYKGAVTNAKSFDLIVIARLFGWSELVTNGSSIWSARYGHEALMLNGKIWVLGGTRNTFNHYNDVWWSTDGISWTNPASGRWSARWRHATVVFDDKMWVLGGYADIQKNDVWWSRDGTSWTNANASRHWSARWGYTTVVLMTKMWVLGGSTTGLGSFTSDVWWSRDGTSWTNANASEHWSARWRHATVVFDDKMWVLGGSDGNRRFNDVWWSTDGASWMNANVSGHWSARSGHATVVFDDKMWVLGGTDGSYKDDVWWSVDGASWTKLSNGTSHWPARVSHTAVVLGDKMFLMGGTIQSKNFNDVWVYQQTN